ncbi:MAG: response regulator [Treponema sp.]|nr:response regulator [Treponema sp.]
MSERLIKVLIVDDEAIVRNGLKKIINWEKIGCTICGEASNGKEALDKINELFPSIVLLDVTMPVMSGIEVLAEVHNNPKNYPGNPQFIILSGYSDFDYAHKAINYGAKGYLVKPVDEDILEEKIIALANEVRLESETNTLRTKSNKENLAKKFSQMFLFGAVDDAFNPEEDSNDTFRVAFISPVLCGCEGQLQSLKFAIEHSFKFCKFIYFSMEAEMILVLKNEEDFSVEHNFNALCKALQKKGSIAAIGKSGKGLQGALDSYNQAKKLYSRLFFFENIPFITEENIDSKTILPQKPTPSEDVNLFSCIGDLVKYIEIYDLENIGKIIQEQREALKTSTKTADQVKKICMAFIVELSNQIRTKHPEKELTAVSAMDLVNLIYSQNYFDEMIRIVSDYTNGLAEAFTSNSSNSTILKVIQYVKSNYNTDLKLEMLGNLFNCNSAYLGKKFREYTGVPFNTYMDIIRIEKAKNMIATTDLKIYEISKLVGYSNTDYFYLKFKKHTNMTPKEFKASQTKTQG